MNDGLKSAVRIVEVRRIGIERTLRSLRESHAATTQRIGQLERQREKLECKILALGPMPNSSIASQALLALADESHQLRRDIEKQRSEQADLQETLKKIDASCANKTRALLALRHKNAFLQERQKHAARRHHRRQAVGVG